MFDRAEYNGVKLLPLPETLDVSEFPYLIFAKGDNNIIILHAFTEKVYMTADHFLTAGVAGTLRRFALENDSYEQLADLPYSGGENIFTNKFSGIFWSNWDIQYPIGGIYFYGSTPIPTTRWISHRFDADFVKKENRVIVNAVQNDNSSRTFIISLLENGEKWFPPQGTEIYLLYQRPDGQNGSVSDAAVLTENIVSLIPPEDVFEVNGIVLVSVAFEFETNTLRTFNFEIHVEKDPSVDASGVGMPESFHAVKTENTITVTATYGLREIVTTIVLDDNGYPMSVTKDGKNCTLSWEGFE